jgi:stage IV sporulation protein A
MKKLFAATLATVMLLTACSSTPGGSGDISGNSDTPGKAVTSDTLYVKKVENLPEDFILGMDASCVPALEAGGVKYYDHDAAQKDVYEILSEKAGIPIADNAALLELLTELAASKRAYDQISDALASVKATGYGVVLPEAEEMHLDAPEILKKNGAYGVRIKAGAPSIHMIRVDVDTQIQPMVGDEQQSRELISYLGGEDPDKLWQSNIFGKSVYALIQEGLTAKLVRTPEDVRNKFRGSLTRIVNEGATGLICLIL